MDKFRREHRIQQPTPEMFDASGKWGCGLVVVAALCITIAILCPYWLENHYEPTFAKMGLWIRCAAGRDDYRTNFYRSDLTGECRWILVPTEYPLPFLAIQVFFAISWILLLLTAIRLSWFILKSCLNSEQEHHLPIKNMGILLLVSVILGSIAVIMFGVMVEGWTTRSRDNFISWGYWLAMLGVVAEIGGCVIIMIKSRQHVPPQPYDTYIY